MAITTQRRLINPRLGTYFGIFTSCFVALVLLLMIFEQLGVSDKLLATAMLLGPIGLYALVGVAGYSRDTGDFFVAGRRVPPVYSGLAMASAALGGTGLVACTGLFFINGFDAWCIAIGMWSGFTVMALLIAPYMRKFGAYTLPGYFGRRFESSTVRLAAASLLFLPTLLMAAAELRMGALAAGWLVGVTPVAMTLLLAVALLAAVLPGGMRSLSWTSMAQGIVALLALLVPVAVVAALETNLPLPQMSHGPVLRGIGRLEAIYGVPIAIAPPLGLELAGQDIVPLAHRIAQPFTSVGPLAFIFLSLSTMCGVAAAPWVLPRCGMTPTVYATRKACLWAVVFSGLILITAAAVAVFLRDNLMDRIVGHGMGDIPGWLKELAVARLALIEPTTGSVQLGNIGIARDAVLFTLPKAAGFPDVAQYLALAGAIAASLAGAAAAAVTLGLVVAEDGAFGLLKEAPAAPLRLQLGRAGILAATVLASWIAIFVQADPFDLMMWALTLSASAIFPVLVLSIWWKRLNAAGALAGMAAGFGVAVIGIVAGETIVAGLSGPLASVVGAPVSFAVCLIANRLGPRPGRHVLAMVTDMRLPGGETVLDHEVRLQRLKQQGH